MTERIILEKAKNYYIEHAFSEKVRGKHVYRSTIVTEEYPRGIDGWSQTPIEHWAKTTKRLEIYDDSQGGRFRGVKGMKWQLVDPDIVPYKFQQEKAPQDEVKPGASGGSILHEIRALLYEIRDKLS